MVPSLDIFKISGGGVLWRDAVATFETAKARIRKLALSSPGEYFILDQKAADLRNTAGFTKRVPQCRIPQVKPLVWNPANRT